MIPHPLPPRSDVEAVDAAEAKCPYAKGPKCPPSSRPCKVCGASSNEGCRAISIANYSAIRAIRAALAQTEGEEGGHEIA